MINQFATPGLGSLMARRFAAGLGQLLLAILGFILVLAWFKSLAVFYYDLWNYRDAVPVDHRLGIGGLLLFASAWLWALLTSLRLLREAKQAARQTPGQERPPVIEPLSARRPT